jgi:hypothetical protein
MRLKRFLPVLVTIWLFLPQVGLAVLAGVAFGWGVPVAFAAGLGFMLWSASRPEREVGKVRAVIEFVGLTLLGGVVGGLLVGGFGAIFGFVVGFLGRLSQVPITPGPSFGFLRRKRHRV